MARVLSSVLLLVAFPFYFQVIQGVILSDTPQSRNVSEGTLVEFTCATPETGLASFTITTDVTLVNTMSSDVILPNGDRQLTLSFIAPSEHQLVNIACIASRFNAMSMLVVNTSTAILMVQGPLPAVGDLTSSEVDHCTLHFTWTAPYTLQGVPINYYTINITRHSDGTVLRSDTTNTTEYLYTVSSLGETLEVVVAAVNGAGTGNTSSITTQTPSSINDVIIGFTSTVARKNNDLSFNISIEGMVCGNAVNSVTVEACNSSSCVNVTGILNMSADDVRRVMATFTNLEENSKYNTTVYVQYNGGVVQQSQPVEITYDILITDEDAEEIDTTATFTITGVFVPNITTTPSITTVSYTPTAQSLIPITITLSIILVIIVVMVISTVMVIALLVIYLMKKKKRNPHKTMQSWTITENHTPNHGAGDDNQQSVNKQTIDNGNTNYPDQQTHHHQDHQFTDQQEYASLEIVKYLTPVPAFDKSIYSTVLMSQGEQECIENLDRMEDLETTPNHHSVYELLQPLSSLWYQLGNALGLAPYLDEVRTNNHSDSERLRAVLYHWETSVDQVRPYTWETLVAALASNQVGATFLATELSKNILTTAKLCYIPTE